MKTEVTGVGLSVKLHYDIKEDLLNLGAIGESPEMRLDDWALGARADIMSVALRLLAESKDDEVLVIGLVPSVRPSEGAESAEEEDTGLGELGGW